MSTRPIELALNRQNRSDSELRRFAGHLLGLMDEYAPEGESLDTAGFRSKLRGYRDALLGPEEEVDLAGVVHACLDHCERFLKRAGTFNAEREKELAEVVRVLQEMVDTLRGEAKDFESGFAKSSENLAKIVEINDIRELKRALSKEVDDLKRVVAERQKREEVTYAKMATRVKTLEANLVQAQAEAATDALTTLPNRGAFDRTLASWIAQATECGEPFAVALVDIDDFKHVNDNHGHQIGDRVLVSAAQILGGGLRGSDVVARYGGDEFAILLAKISASQAKSRLTTLVNGMATSYAYEIDGNKGAVTFSISVGVSEFTGGDTIQSLVKRADEALYEAKRKGKKRVEMRVPSFLRRLVG